MKKPWRDGTRAIVLSPMDLMARLAAMVPPPGFPMTRFHGVLAAHAKDRAEVVPTIEEEEDGGAAPAQLRLFGDAAANDGDADPEADPAPRKSWAWLLRHVFAVDVTVCPLCDGRMRWLDVATTPDAIAELLARAGHRARAPPDAPVARRSPRRRAPSGQLELDLRPGPNV